MPLLRYRGPKIARLAVFDHMNDCDWKLNHVAEPIGLLMDEALFRLHPSVTGYAGIRLQPCSIHTRQISCNEPRYLPKDHYILRITARCPGYHR